MVQAVVRWGVYLLAALVLGPVAGRLTGGLRAMDGGEQLTLLLSERPASGLLAGVGAVGVALVAGVLGSWAVGRRSGLFCAGLVLAWAAWGTGRMDRVISLSGSGGRPLMTVALEGAVIGVLGVLAAGVILRTPTREAAKAAARDPEHEHHHLPEEPTALWDSTAPAALLAAAVMAGVAVWVFAADTLKGQTVAAAVIAGVFAASAGRVVSQRVSGAVFVAGVALLAAASPAAASVVHGQGLLRDALAGNLMALARPMPLDWLAGAFLGVPLGLTWTASAIERHAPGDKR